VTSLSIRAVLKATSI